MVALHRPWGALAVLAGILLAQPVAAQIFKPETFTLDNGMTVVVLPNHRVPMLTHMVWYKVGSADEEPGRTGLAHMVEHMMFKGTKTVAAGQFSRIVAQNGGRDNAFTTADYTAFYQIVASDKLETVMRLEADRMANLRLDDKDFQPERQVVLEERRMRVENEPSSRLDEQMTAALFLNNPYHHPVIGWDVDIERYRLKDVVDFHTRWYAPNNAILVVSGDITARELAPLARKYYGVLSARPVPERLRPREPAPAAARTVLLRDENVAQPAWSRDYLAPGYRDGDVRHAYPLQILAEIVGGGTTGRLYTALVVEQALAADAGVGYDPSRIGPSVFSFGVSPRPGVPLDRIETAVEDQIARLLKDGVTADEVARAKNRLRASVVYARDSVNVAARILGASLASGQTIEDIESWPDRIGAVTVAQVNDAARAVLKPERSVTGRLLPLRDGEGASR